jgi:predicted methyltransferase
MAVGLFAPAAADPGAAPSPSPAYRFADPRRWAPVFEHPARDTWQLPDRLIEALGLRPGQVVADIGAGTGYFTRRIARAVGPGGRVYAVDLEPGLLEYLAWRTEAEGLTNVTTLVAGEDDSRLPAGCCDLALLVNTYYLIADRPGYLRHLRSRLRPGGSVVVVDWRRHGSPGHGPRPEHKLSRETVHREAGAAGLCVEERDFLPLQDFYRLTPCPAPRDPTTGDPS